MFIDTLIDKVKSALGSSTCVNCDQKLQEGLKFCHRCREKLGLRQPKAVLSGSNYTIHAASNFNPNIKRILYGHKFYNRVEHIPQLSGLLIEYWNTMPPSSGFKAVHPENVLVIPIPPHHGELSRIELFASQLARHFGYDYRPDLLSWMRNVKPQHRIHDKQSRLHNINQSLHLKSGVVSGYEKIIVVDDITTTGATFLEAARAFRCEAANLADTNNHLVCLAVTRVPLGAQIRAAEIE